jgi:hypothetical protein
MLGHYIRWAVGNRPVRWTLIGNAALVTVIWLDIDASALAWDSLVPASQSMPAPAVPPKEMLEGFEGSAQLLHDGMMSMREAAAQRNLDRMARAQEAKVLRALQSNQLAYAAFAYAEFHDENGDPDYGSPYFVGYGDVPATLRAQAAAPKSASARGLYYVGPVVRFYQLGQGGRLSGPYSNPEPMGALDTLHPLSSFGVRHSIADDLSRISSESQAIARAITQMRGQPQAGSPASSPRPRPHGNSNTGSDRSRWPGAPEAGWSGREAPSQAPEPRQPPEPRQAPEPRQVPEETQSNTRFN